LSKVLLELGGKNPVVIDTSANIELAAKRIVNMKFMNAGQTCVTADMIYVAKAVKDQFVGAIINQTKIMVGTDAKECKDYSKIINEHHTKRVLKYLENQDDKIVFQAGKGDVASRFVPPTILLNPAADSLLNQEEIFGPILPIFEFEDIRDVLGKIQANDKPLAIYYFGDTCSQNYQILKKETSSGALVANDIGMQYLSFTTGFGGVGGSGVGKIRGYEGFKYCSNQKVVLERASHPWLDLAFRYAPTTPETRRKFDFLTRHIGSYTLQDITCVIKKIVLAIALILCLVYFCRKQ
jgi:aldehyde dehydrogenase (NAD+)